MKRPAEEQPKVNTPEQGQGTRGPFSFNPLVLFSVVPWICIAYLVFPLFSWNFHKLQPPDVLPPFQVFLALIIAIWFEKILLGQSLTIQCLHGVDRYLARSSRRALYAWLTMWLVFVLTLTYISVSRYYNLSLPCSGDLSIFAQSLWSTSHGGFFTNTQEAWMSNLDRASHFSLHNQPLLFLLAPVYWVFQSPLALLLVQDLVIPFGGLAVFLLAKRYTQSDLAGLFLTASYWLQEAVLYNTLDFHPVAFVLLFIPAAFYFFDVGRWKWAWISVALMVMCKENMAIVGVFFGLYAALKYRAVKSGMIAAVVCGLWFFVTVYYVTPSFSGTEFHYLHRYSHWGTDFPQIFLNILTHPLDAVRYAIAGSKLYYLFQWFFSYFCLPILSPAALLPAIPELAQNLLSNFTPDLRTYERTSCSLAAVLMCASIMSLGKIGKIREGSGHALWMSAALAVFALAVTDQGALHFQLHAAGNPDTPLMREMALVKRVIRPQDSLSVHKDLAYQFANRSDIYFFPINCLSTDKVLIRKGRPVWPKPDQYPKYLKKIMSSKNHRKIYEGKKLVLWQRIKESRSPER